MLEAIAAVVAGFAAAGIMMGLRVLSGRRLPRWLVPAAAGAGMLAFTVWAEYAWYPRIQMQLPEGAVIVEAPENRAIWRPWTFWRPLVTQVAVADTRALMSNPDMPSVFLVPMSGLARWSPGGAWLEAIDCTGARRAVMTDGMALAPDGTLTGGAWMAMSAGDGRLAALCNRPAG